MPAAAGVGAEEAGAKTPGTARTVGLVDVRPVTPVQEAAEGVAVAAEAEAAAAADGSPLGS